MLFLIGCDFDPEIKFNDEKNEPSSREVFSSDSTLVAELSFRNGKSYIAIRNSEGENFVKDSIISNGGYHDPIIEARWLDDQNLYLKVDDDFGDNVRVDTINCSSLIRKMNKNGG